MNTHITHTDRQESWISLDASETVTADELARASGLSADQLNELVEYGALMPVAACSAAQEPDRLFSATYVITLRAACHVQRDFDLDLFTAGLLVGYLMRIDALERQIQSLHAQSTAHAGNTKAQHVG